MTRGTGSQIERIYDSSALADYERANLLKKRTFDLTICLVFLPLWLPILAVLALLNLIFSGPPIFYLSKRRVWRDEISTIIKFRTMVPNAAEILNRDTVPIEDQRFLNLPRTSALYTKIGRIYEALSLTEIPQLIHVLTGEMSLIGNRPLPENVLAALRQEFSNTNSRFLTRAGLSGPTQVMGRDLISDETRLNIEEAYCKVCLNSYSWRLDAAIIWYTALYVFKFHAPFTESEIMGLLRRFDSTGVLAK